MNCSSLIFPQSCYIGSSRVSLSFSISSIRFSLSNPRDIVGNPSEREERIGINRGLPTMPLELLSEIFNEGGILKVISLSNIRPIIISFYSSQCRLIPYLHQRPIFFKANSIHSSIVAILELNRGAQCLIEVIRSSGEGM